MSVRAMVRLVAAGIGLGVVACGLTGCVSVEPADPVRPVAFAPEDYPAVFDAARDALDEWRFTLDRVDAAHGVITTAPKRTAGIATPWDREQSTLGQEVRDLTHQHERVARVSFDPPEAPTSVSVLVTIERVRRPGWRVESDAIRQSTHARDPQARRQGDEPEFREPIGEDRALGLRLLERIRALAGLPEPGA